MGLLLLLVGLPAVAVGGSFLRSQLDIRHPGSKRHTVLAQLADTDRRPPGALLAMRAGVQRDPGDFGSGIAKACGCPVPSRTGPTPSLRCCVPEPVGRILAPACGITGCVK